MTKTVDEILAEASFDKSFILGYPYSYFIDELRLSHSTLQTFETCPRKFEFSKLYQNPQHSDSLATAFGTAIHRGFQEYLITHNYDRAVYAMMLEYPWEMGESPMKDRSAEGALVLLDEMIKQFPEERYELAWISGVDGELPCVEVSFKITFKGWAIKLNSLDSSQTKTIPITYAGFMDLVLLDKVEQKYIVVDIKTTSDRLEDLTPKYKFSDQTVPYALVLNSLLGLELDELDVGYYVARPSLVEPKVDFYLFYKSKEDISDWANGMKRTLHEIDYFAKHSWFPRTRQGCSAFNKTCPYFSICNDRDNKRTQLALAYSGELAPQKEIDAMISLELDLEELV